MHRLLDVGGQVWVQKPTDPPEGPWRQNNPALQVVSSPTVQGCPYDPLTAPSVTSPASVPVGVSAIPASITASAPVASPRAPSLVARGDASVALPDVPVFDPQPEDPPSAART